MFNNIRYLLMVGSNVGCTTFRLQTLCIRNIEIFTLYPVSDGGCVTMSKGQRQWSEQHRLHPLLDSSWSHQRIGPYYGRLHQSPRLTSTTHHPLQIPTGHHHCPQKSPFTLTRDPLSDNLLHHRLSSPKIQITFQLYANCCSAASENHFHFQSPPLRSPFLRAALFFTGAVRPPFLSSMRKLNCSKAVIFQLFKVS